MSVNSDESQGQSQGHPAWQTILDELPESLHGIIRPKLEEWDRGVQAKLQDVHSQYDPYKNIVEQQYDPEFLQGAIMLAQQIQQDPNAVVEQAVNAFGLENWVSKEEAQRQFANQQQQSPPDPYEVQYGQYQEQQPYQSPPQQQFDITNHPVVKQLTERLEQLQGTVQTREQADANAKAQAEFVEYLGGLEEKHGSFDKEYVTALISQGVDGDVAVQKYNQLIAGQIQPGQQQQQTNAPVVMGGSQTAGSGMPAQEVDFGQMKNGQVNDLVIQMLQQQAQDNNVSG